MRRTGLCAEVKRLKREESTLLDTPLKAKQVAGLTQADVARRMGMQARSVARLEQVFATGKHSPAYHRSTRLPISAPTAAGISIPSRYHTATNGAAISGQ